MILYGAVAGVATDKLFIGGLVPGVLMILVVAAYAIRAASFQGAAPAVRPREVAAALWDAKWDLGLPTLVIGADRGGSPPSSRPPRSARSTPSWSSWPSSANPALAAMPRVSCSPRRWWGRW